MHDVAVRLWRSWLAATRWRLIIAASGFVLATLLVLALNEHLRTETVGLLLCALAAIYLVGRYFLHPRTRPERGLQLFALAVLVVGTLCVEDYLAVADMLGSGSVRTWNVYHYYLGSKYFDELGYTELYPQTILADREGLHWLQSVQQIRDMTDYQVKPVQNIVPAERAPRFSARRWQQFKHDVSALLPREPAARWDDILTDRGYNATPFWNTAGSLVSRSFDLSNRSALTLAVSIDLLLYLTMIGALWWAFGAEASMLAFLCFALLPFNLSRLVGGFIQYDWFAAVVLGLCFLKKRLAIPAGIAFGYATMARLFPALLVGALAFPAARRLLGKQRLDRFTKKLALGFIATCAIGFVIGASSAKGMSSWHEWYDKIETHNSEMTFGMGRVGLRHLFTHRLGGPFEPTEEARKQTYEAQEPAYGVAAALGLGLFLAAVWRRGKVNAVLLGTMLVYVLLVPSHYYWSILALWLLWQPEHGERSPPALLPRLTAFVVPAGYYAYARGEPFQYAQYLRFDWLLGLCLIGISAWLIHADRRARRVSDRPA